MRDVDYRCMIERGLSVFLDKCSHFFIFFVATASSLVMVIEFVWLTAKKKRNGGAKLCW